MKKETKQSKKLLPLSKETMKKLAESELKEVIGGGSCYKPPEES
jgi:bacteriocin-like protein